MVHAASTATRERILLESAELFAHQGYTGTTTREIADAVGIRQPSLFHHFSSKGAIAEALLEWDLGRALPRVKSISRSALPAAVRLYRYLVSDVRHLASAPYNLGGVYTEEVIGRAEFAPWAALRDELHEEVERVVRDGVAAGEFVDVDPAFVREAIAGILVRALTVYSGGHGEAARLADDIATLVVRGLLVDTTTLDRVRRAAATQAN